MMNLSKHFTLDELIKSPTAQRKNIKNIPNAEELENLQRLVDNILEPLRQHYGRPIIITSGYRCEKLNKLVGGSATSQHRLGQAADIRSVSDHICDNKEIFDMIQEMNLPFDQLIDEYDYDWVHVSFGPKMRHQVLHAKKVGEKTVYKS